MNEGHRQPRECWNDNFDLSAYLEKRRGLINRHLDMVLPQDPSVRLVQAMRHSLLAGGKRIRSVLCLAAAEAVGQHEGKQVLNLACALEMVHTYSLIHDDLPAMDNDSLRRGIPTCHVAFDEATAILAGDALLTLAYELLSSLPDAPGRDISKQLQVIRIFSIAVGYKGMIAGQMQDILAEGRQVPRHELETMHRLKTGALIEASICCGALLAGATSEQVCHLGQYGRSIGLAFQIADDILNVEGDPAAMGKAVGTDADLDKSTYPALLGLDQSRELAREQIAKALKAVENFDHRSDPLRAIAKFIVNRRQ